MMGGDALIVMSLIRKIIMIDMNLKTNIFEAMVDGTVALVVVTDTGGDLDKESILASARIMGQTPEGDWELELSITDEYGSRESLNIVGRDLNFIDAASTADRFVRAYSDDPTEARIFFYGVMAGGCPCGECYGKGVGDARA